MVGQWDPLKMQVSILKISGIGSPLPWLGPRELLQNVWIHIFCLKIFRRRVGFRSPPTIVWRFPFRHGGTPRNIIHFERWCFRLQTIQLLGGTPIFSETPISQQKWYPTVAPEIFRKDFSDLVDWIRCESAVLIRYESMLANLASRVGTKPT